MKKHIPNFITSLNLLCGCIAISQVLAGYLVNASIFIIIATVFDFLDGFTARLLKAYSEIGKQLDSLSDLVSFGLAPSFIIFHLMKESTQLITENNIIYSLAPNSAFLIAIFSALRLARFNIDENQSESFTGLPTPANAYIILSFPLILSFTSANNILLPIFTSITENFVSLLVLTILSSWLLVSRIPLFSLKFKNLKWADNMIRYIFIFCSIPILIWLKFTALPIIILLYILLSLTENVFITPRHK